MRGLRTLVLEAKPEVGSRLHTTGILVKEVEAEWDIPARFVRRIHRVRLYGPSLGTIDLESPGYYFLSTDTGGLLRWFARHAREGGAQVRTGQKFEGASLRDDRFAFNGVSARYLIGADGGQSSVARRFGLGRNREFLLGAEWEMRGIRGLDEEALHVFLDSKIARGYIAWVVPGVGVTQVGLACRLPTRPDLPAFFEKAGRIFDFSRARVVGRRGGLIPIGGPLRPIARDRVMLIGDAAGLVSPLTAGGIHTAVHYGRRAAQLVSEWMLDRGPEPGRALAREIPRYFWKGLLRKVMDSGPPNHLIDLGLKSPALRALAQVVFFHHRGLLSPVAWRDIALAVVGQVS
jgi:flavin-dependent dehydrogenase